MNKKAIILIGAGGHAKVVLNILQLLRYDVIGVVTHDASGDFPVPVLGDDSAVFRFPPGEVLLANGVGSIGNSEKRTAVFEMFANRGYAFVSLVHPLTILAGGISLGEGTQVMAGAIIQPGAAIGKNCIVNTGASVDHDCRIGDHVHLAPGVVLSGGVQVGDRSHIGTGAVIIQNIIVGKDCLVGAGTIVMSDVPSACKYLGNPGRNVDK